MANVSFSAAAAGLPTTAIWLRSGYQLGDAQLGLVLGAMGLGVALSELPWGMATDRWGDRPVLLSGLGATALGLLAMMLFVVPSPGAIPALPWLVLAMCAVGLLGGSVNGSSGRAIMRWFQEGERGLAMSIRQTAVPMGGGLGALILPWLASTAGFRSVYGVLAAMCAASALLTWRWLHEPPDDMARPALVAAPLVIARPSPGSGAQLGHDGAASPAVAASATPTIPAASTVATASTVSATSATAVTSVTSVTARRSPLQDIMIWRVVLGIGILCVPQFAVLTFGTVFLHDFGHIGIAGITGTMVAIQLGAMVMRVWSGRFTDRHGNRRGYVRGSTLVAAASFVILALAVSGKGHVAQAALIAIVVFAGICVSAWHGVAYTELATLAGKDRAGTALGMVNTVVYLGLFLAPLSIPHLLAASSWAGVWLAAAMCALLTYPLFPRAAA